MKCVRRKVDNNKDEVKRVSDDEAFELVALSGFEDTGHWHYVPKSVWKAAGRP